MKLSELSSSKRTDLDPNATLRKKDWARQYFEESLLLVQELKAKNKVRNEFVLLRPMYIPFQPRELFVVCSFLVIASLELCSFEFFGGEELSENVIREPEVHDNIRQKKVSTKSKVKSILGQLWMTQDVMFDQRRSNVQSISYVIECTDQILRCWCKMQSRSVLENDEHSCLQILNQATGLSSSGFSDVVSSEYLTILLIGIRHLLLFGLYPVLGAPSSSDSNVPTTSTDPALLVRGSENGR